jgi:3-hydroxybutyryl-CoA dehydratase
MTPSVGRELGPWRVESIDPERMKVFAVVLADPNPIHLDRAAVRRAGLGERVINQGPASFGYVLNMLRESLPDAILRDLNVRLTTNVFEGDGVTAAGLIEREVVVDGERQLVCQVWLDTDDGRRAVEGTARLALPQG